MVSLRHLHQPLRLHPAFRRRPGGRHGQSLGGTGLPDRDVPLRRHQVRSRLQGGRRRGHEILHQRQDVVDALDRVKQANAGGRSACVFVCQGRKRHQERSNQSKKKTGDENMKNWHSTTVIGAIALPERRPGAEDQGHRLHRPGERPARAVQGLDRRPCPRPRSSGSVTPPASSRLASSPRGQSHADMVMGLAASC